MVLLKKLIKIGLLTPKGLFHFAWAIAKGGVNLVALLHFAAKTQPNTIALSEEKEELNYQQLQEEVNNLVEQLHHKKLIKKGQKVAIFCKNHTALIKAIFACSRLGADIYLLNIEMNFQQANKLAQKYKFDVVIYDILNGKFVQECHFAPLMIPAYFASEATTIQRLSKTKLTSKIKIPRANKGKIIVLTGGTTGDFKIASRKPSVFAFLNPFFALLKQLNLDNYHSVYVATPIYHGFGLSSVLIAIVLGSKITLLGNFDAPIACQLIKTNQIEVVTLVPIMLKRMLQHSAGSLSSLELIIAGGATLSPSLVEESNALLGKKLANLYGTSEAGFSIMATPNYLTQNSQSIGKPIGGVLTKIVGNNQKEVPKGKIGRLYIRSKWTISNKQSAWINTGDLAYKNAEGFYFLCGRSDDMIVSGGENVYPIELEHILSKHFAIKEVAVVGIDDLDFGQRLKAFVVLKKDSILPKEELLKWLKINAARYQQPKEIRLVAALPYTAIGKINRKALRDFKP